MTERPPKRSKCSETWQQGHQGSPASSREAVSSRSVADLLAFDRPAAGAQAPAGDWEEVFAGVAHRLLDPQCDLVIAGKPHRLVEIEAYFQTTQDGPHPDPFVHGDPHQKETAEWYFHRQGGGGYKGGTYKGLDIAFSDDSSKRTFAGMLIRSLEVLSTGVIVEGPCRCVDHILSLTGKASIAELVDSDDFSRSCDMTQGISDLLYFRWVGAAEGGFGSAGTMRREVLRTPRIGLSLRVTDDRDLRLDYVARLYRFVTRSESIAKGRIHTVCALLAANPKMTVAHLIARVGSSEKAITNYRENFLRGFQGRHRPAEFVGKKSLSTLELCRMLGSVMSQRTDLSVGSPGGFGGAGAGAGSPASACYGRRSASTRLSFRRRGLRQQPLRSKRSGTVQGW